MQWQFSAWSWSVPWPCDRLFLPSGCARVLIQEQLQFVCASLMVGGLVPTLRCRCLVCRACPSSSWFHFFSLSWDQGIRAPPASTSRPSYISSFKCPSDSNFPNKSPLILCFPFLILYKQNICTISLSWIYGINLLNPLINVKPRQQTLKLTEPSQV